MTIYASQICLVFIDFFMQFLLPYSNQFSIYLWKYPVAFIQVWFELFKPFIRKINMDARTIRSFLVLNFDFNLNFFNLYFECQSWVFLFSYWFNEIFFFSFSRARCALGFRPKYDRLSNQRFGRLRNNFGAHQKT